MASYYQNNNNFSGRPLQPYDWNEGKVVKSNSEIIKRIEVEETFSSYVAKDLKSKRYGINGCCSFDQLEGSIINRELCEWQDITKPIYTREYKDIAWLYDTEPWPEWLQFGDFDPAVGPCIEDDCQTYPDPVGSTRFTQLSIDMDIVESVFTPTGDWPGATGPNNPAINETFTGILYVLAKNPEDRTDDNWTVIGKSKIPTGPYDDVLGDGGNLWVDPVSGTMYWRVHCYYNVPGSGIVDGANPKDLIKFIVVDGPKQYEVKFDQNIWPTANGTMGFQDYHVYPEPVYGVPYCAVCIEQYQFTQKNIRFNKICDDTFKKCWFCGMEPVYASGNNYLNEPNTPGQEPIGFRCVDDSACIHIYVENTCVEPIQNYPILLDGIDVGSTDEYGVFRFTITDKWLTETGRTTAYDASPESDFSTHTINHCEFCFITWGNCNQHHIDIVVDDPRRECSNCKPQRPKINCIDITPEPELVTPDTPEETETSWLCDTDGERQWYGCVEIIGNQGYQTQAECEENCVEPPPPPSHWSCMQISSIFGTSNSSCQEIVGLNPGTSTTYDTEQECLDGCQDWQATGCWGCSGAPLYEAQWFPGVDPNYTDCFSNLTEFDQFVAQGNNFCEEPPKGLYFGCDCTLSLDTNGAFANNGEGIVNPAAATFATLAACEFWSSGNKDCDDGGGIDIIDWDTQWENDFIGIANGNMYEMSNNAYSDLVGNEYSNPMPMFGAATTLPQGVYDQSPDLQFFPNNLEQANRFLMVPIKWPSANYFQDGINVNPDWTDEFVVGSDMEFTIHVNIDTSNPGEVHPFGMGASWALQDGQLASSDANDHMRAFYVLNRITNLNTLGLTPGSFNENMQGSNVWTVDEDVSYADYVTITQDYANYPNQGYDGAGAVNYYFKIKFHYELALGASLETPTTMPLIEGGGTMFYLPVLLMNNCVKPPNGLLGTMRDITFNFIPTDIGDLTDFYVQGRDQYTGELVNYVIGQGISGTIEGCEGVNCPECQDGDTNTEDEEGDKLTCYRCNNGSVVGFQFENIVQCPPGWTENFEEACD